MILARYPRLEAIHDGGRAAARRHSSAHRLADPGPSAAEGGDLPSGGSETPRR